MRSQRRAAAKGGRGSLLDLLQEPTTPSPPKSRTSASLLNSLGHRQPAPVETAPPPPVIAPPLAPTPVAAPSGEAALDRLEKALADARRQRQPAIPIAPVAPAAPVEPDAPKKRKRRKDKPAAVAARPPVATASPMAGLSPIALFQRLLRKWYWLAAGALVGGAIAAVYAISLPNEYQSIARIVLEPRGITPLRDSVSPQGLNSEATIAYSQSQVDIIRSTSVLGPVIENEDLRNDREFVDRRHWLDKLGLDRVRQTVFGDVTAEAPTGNVLEQLHERLYVGRLNQSFVIEIGFTSEDPNKAARLANSITRSYLSSESGAQNAAAQSANDDLTSRLDTLRNNVARSEELIEAHKKKFNLVETNGRLVDEESLARLNDQLARATAQTAEARSLVELAENIDVNDVVGGGLPSALATPTLLQARLQYQRTRANLSKLSVKLGERHPQRREAAAELAAAADSIRSELRRLTAANTRELARARSREADLKGSVEDLRDAALAANTPKAQLRELERRLNADRQVYEAFLQRSRETNEQTKIASRNARVISDALPPDEKSGPLRKFMVLSGAVIGGSIAGLLALLPLVWGALTGAAAAPVPPSRKTRKNEVTDGDDLYGTPVVSPETVQPLAAPAQPAPVAVLAKPVERKPKKKRSGRKKASAPAIAAAPEPSMSENAATQAAEAAAKSAALAEAMLETARREAHAREEARDEAARRVAATPPPPVAPQPAPPVYAAHHYPAPPMMPSYPMMPPYAPPPPWGYAPQPYPVAVPTPVPTPSRD